MALLARAYSLSTPVSAIRLTRSMPETTCYCREEQIADMPFLEKQLLRKISFKIRTYNRACRPLGEDFIHFATAFYSPQFIQQNRVEYTVGQRSGELGSLLAKDIVKIHQVVSGWNAEISDSSFLPLVSGPSRSPIIAEPQIDHHPRLAKTIERMFEELTACREISQLMITWRGRDAFYADSRKRRGSGWNNRTTITSLQQRVPLAMWRQAQMEMERLASSMSLKMIRKEDQHHNAQVYRLVRSVRAYKRNEHLPVQARFGVTMAVGVPQTRRSSLARCLFKAIPHFKFGKYVKFDPESAEFQAWVQQQCRN